jgi:hypothetical protein
VDVSVGSCAEQQQCRFTWVLTVVVSIMWFLRSGGARATLTSTDPSASPRMWVRIMLTTMGLQEEGRCSPESQHAQGDFCLQALL